MSSTTASMNHNEIRSTALQGLWRAGAVAGLCAASATTIAAATARAAGIALAIDGEKIPLAGFAQFTVLGAVVGVLMAKVLSCTARRPRRTFIVTTGGLSVLSLVPDALVDTTAGSMAVLMLTHVIAAVIVIPVFANRIGRAR